MPHMPKRQSKWFCERVTRAARNDDDDDFELEEMTLDDEGLAQLDPRRKYKMDDAALQADPEDDAAWKGLIQGGFKARQNRRQGSQERGRAPYEDDLDQPSGQYGRKENWNQKNEPYSGFWERRDLGKVDVTQFDTNGKLRQLSIEDLEARVEDKLIGSQRRVQKPNNKPRAKRNGPPAGPAPEPRSRGKGKGAPDSEASPRRRPEDQDKGKGKGKGEDMATDTLNQRPAAKKQPVEDSYTSRKSANDDPYAWPEDKNPAPGGGKGRGKQPVEDSYASRRSANDDPYALPRDTAPAPKSQTMGSWGAYAPPQRDSIEYGGYLGAEDADDEMIPKDEWIPEEEFAKLTPKLEKEFQPVASRRLMADEVQKAPKKNKLSGWLMPTSEAPPPPKREVPKKEYNEDDEAKFDWSNLDEAREQLGESKFAKMYRAAMRRMAPLPWHEVETKTAWTDSSEKSWQDLGISGTKDANTLVRTLEKFGLGKPNRFQAQVLSEIMTGDDGLMTSQTGSGKTIAFVLPLLMKHVLPLADIIKPRSFDPLKPVHTFQKQYAMPRLIIVAPSRELAMQTYRVVSDLLAPFPELNVTALIGGSNYNNQDDNLKNRRPLVVVGTPGRLMDHATEGRLLLSELRAIVYDEIDRLLTVSRADHIELITKAVKDVTDCQRILVSATASANEVSRRFADAFLKDGWQHFGPKTSLELPPRVLHLANGAPDMEKKIKFLKRLSNSRPFPNGVIVFCNNYERARKVTEQMNYMNIPTAVLSGNCTKAYREESIRLMQTGKIDFLVATDVATHGLDFREITHVVNFEMPGDSLTYAHRAGRCGRQGRNGIVITLAGGGKNNHRLVRYADEINLNMFEANVVEGDLGIIDGAQMNRVGLVRQGKTKKKPTLTAGVW